MVAWKRQGSLIFIEKHLEPDILVVRIAAIEYQLNVGSHGHNVIAAPPILAQ